MRKFRFNRRDSAKAGRWAASVVALILLLVSGSAPGQPLTIPVTAADGTPLGTITVEANGQGVVGGFTSTFGDPPSLEAAAERNNEHHWNWYQVVVRDNDPPNDAAGNPLKPPYVDPPLGGIPPQLADNFPWYWDEWGDEKPEPTTEGYDPRYDLENQLLDTNEDGTVDTLNYVDYPWGPEGTSLEFNTWLASLNADGSLHSWHGGFAWTWDRPAGGGGGGGGGGRNIDPPGDFGQVVVILGALPPIPEPGTFLLAMWGGIGLLLVTGRRPRARHGA